jgi:hypothetical protein
MEIEFDTGKDAANLAKHGVSLALGAMIFKDVRHIVISSIRPIDGEERFKAIGMVNGKLWSAVHVMRGIRIRFISVRRSNNGEHEIYHRP